MGRDFFEQHRQEVQQPAAALGQLFFVAVEDVSVYDRHLDAVEQNAGLPTLRSVLSSIRGQKQVRQVRSTHRLVINFAYRGARNLLFAILLPALLLDVALTDVLVRRPSVQYMHRLIVHPCRNKKLPIWGQQVGGKLVAPHGASGRGTGLLDDGFGRRRCT